MFIPSASYYRIFTISSSGGAASNADSLPIATTYHNGVIDVSFNLTVTNLSTGVYKISGTVPSGYASEDQVDIGVSATINGVLCVSIVDQGSVDVSVSSRMATFTVPTNFSALAINSSGAVQTGTNLDKTGYTLSQTFPANFSFLSIDGSGRTLLQLSQPNVTIPTVTMITSGVTVNVNLDKSNYFLAQSQTFSTTGSVGSILNITFPTNFSSLSIDSTGSVHTNNSSSGGGGGGLVTGYAAGQDPATLILGATAASWNTAATMGNKINSAASAGDPWTTSLPGSYTAGEAGYIIGNLISNFPTHFSLLAITTSGTVTVDTNLDKSNYFLSNPPSPGNWT